MFRFLINKKSGLRMYGETRLAWIRISKKENSWEHQPDLDGEGDMDAFRSITVH